MADLYDDEEFTVENGTVVDVVPGGVVVRVPKKDGDCGGCRSCAMKRLCGGRDVDHIDLSVATPAGGTPEKGAAVRVAYRPTNAALAALVMFLPALLGLFVGGVIGHRLGGGSDAGLLAGCFIGFAAGVGASFAAARLSPALKPLVRLLPE